MAPTQKPDYYEGEPTEDWRAHMDRGHEICLKCGRCQTCRQGHFKSCPDGPEEIYKREREAAKTRGVRVLPTLEDRKKIAKRQATEDPKIAEARKVFEQQSEAKRQRGRPKKHKHRHPWSEQL